MNTTPLRDGGSKRGMRQSLQQGKSARINNEDSGPSASYQPAAPTYTQEDEPDSTRLHQRGGFPHQLSYDNLAYLTATDIPRRESKPLPRRPTSAKENEKEKGKETPPIPRRTTSAIKGLEKEKFKETPPLPRKKSVIKVDIPNGRQMTVEADKMPTTPGIERGAALRRLPSTRLVRPERAQSISGSIISTTARHTKDLLRQKTVVRLIWMYFSKIVTIYIPDFCLEKFGHMHDGAVKQAWREKVALCTIILWMCGALGFLTYGFVATVCKVRYTVDIDEVRSWTPRTAPHRYVIYGMVYDFALLMEMHNALPGFRDRRLSGTEINSFTGKDITPFFFPTTPPIECNGLIMNVPLLPPCNTPDFPITLTHCHDSTTTATLLAKYSNARIGPVVYEWPMISRPNTTLMVYKESVLDMTPYLQLSPKVKPFGNSTDHAIRSHLGKDASKAFSKSPLHLQMGSCLNALYKAGRVEAKTVGCIASDIILYVSLIIILSVVLIRFVMAAWFGWFISWRLGKLRGLHEGNVTEGIRRSILERGIVPFPMKVTNKVGEEKEKEKEIAPNNNEAVDRKSSNSHLSGDTLNNLKHLSAWSIPSPTTHHRTLRRPTLYHSPYGLEVYTVMLVTAYSEGEEGLRNTMDSLAQTTYSDDHKLMFIVADGLITGSGNTKSTPDIIIDMMELDPNWPSPPAAMSYVAIAEGKKRHNMAQVYVAWYRAGDRCIPTILVVKCGTPEEQGGAKPGNRGKRDSQIILMSFFQKVTFDDAMTPLDYDLFQKIHYLMGVTPDAFEIILMVDADTKVAPDSLARMVASMVTDPLVMGLCGETRIANKTESWVSKIQVFEYFLSHHLAKAFESVFGGVTCLPGCFCMYRIKAPKGDGYWVPILCNPAIVDTYSENRVDTLHKKNLLLLGEDRFLTTLMLGTFPHRKQIFVPRAFCKTVVPAEFKVLLSQRRRWINSTIHNLLELVLVKELCGVFCFSMQFVILLELVGTVVLPAAIIFTFLLLIMAFLSPDVPIIPLALLGAILGLPAILIMLTTRRRVYIFWMLIYLLALPIWNFVLPVYAFWHFDDFSWGQTRKVAGEGGDKGHGGGEGEVDGGLEVVKRRWVDWECERRRGILREWGEREESVGDGESLVEKDVAHVVE